MSTIKINRHRLPRLCIKVHARRRVNATLQQKEFHYRFASAAVSKPKENRR